eukprot:g18423.t1
MEDDEFVCEAEDDFEDCFDDVPCEYLMKFPFVRPQELADLALQRAQLASTAKAEATQWKEFPVWCRKQKRNQQGDSWAQAAAEVVGGSVPSDDSCPSDELLELEV